MTQVGSAELHKINPEGEISADGFTFSAVYKVTVDDIEDGPNVALSATGLPAFDSAWTYGNDGAVTAYHKRRRARRSSIDLIWYVVCLYETPTVSEPQDLTDETGAPVSDPADVPLRIVPSFESELEVVERAKLISYVDHEGNGIAALNGTNDPPTTGSIPLDSSVVPMSSAFVPYVPPLEELTTRLVLRCTRWVTSWHSVYGSTNQVNSAAYSLIGLDAFGNYFNETYQPRELRYRNASVELSVRRDFKVLYRITFELAVKRGGWYRDILDQGRYRKGYASDPDGFGGTIPGGGLIDGASTVIPVRDASGLPVTDPVPFDGLGQPLQEPTISDHVYLRWLTLAEFDVSQLFT